MPNTFTWNTLTPATKPTFYFIGVSTENSSIRRVFPQWAKYINLGDVELSGINLPVHAPEHYYRTVVQFLKNDPLSMGALVTTHKIDLFAAAHDLFDSADPLAQLMGEVSCIAKNNGKLSASAKDPITAGLALEAFLPKNYFAETNAEVVLLGAGGSAIAIDWYLSQANRGTNKPKQITVTNRSTERLSAIQKVHEAAGNLTPLHTRLCRTPADNTAVLNQTAPGSVIVNATGLGKDAPGSPLSPDVVFPKKAFVWELNYRGDLIFLDQARSQQDKRSLTIVDGWVYFIHGWTRVIAEVFQVDIPTSGSGFAELSRIAELAR